MRELILIFTICLIPCFATASVTEGDCGNETQYIMNTTSGITELFVESGYIVESIVDEEDGLYLFEYQLSFPSSFLESIVLIGKNKDHLQKVGLEQCEKERKRMHKSNKSDPYIQNKHRASEGSCNSLYLGTYYNYLKTKKQEIQLDESLRTTPGL